MTMDPIIYEKKGAGAYRVEIHPDVVYVWYGTNDKSSAVVRQFKDARHAYDFYHALPSRNHSSWIICKMLKDHL